jgi:hypothetical protein
MEKRQYPRFETDSPMEYHLPIKGWGTVWPLKGALKDISLKGFYFTCKNRLWMDVGDILHFISTFLPSGQVLKTSTISASRGW